MSNIDEAAYCRYAEQLGYDSMWFADSPTLFSDPFAVMALAAQQTSRIRIGPGVAVAPLRSPVSLACSVATINRLAPGRTVLGIGTGGTGMRAMGQRPQLLAEFDSYAGVLAALLRGEVVDYAPPGRPARPTKILMHDSEYMDLEPKVPLFISALGPRTIELAGRRADGLLLALPPLGMDPSSALRGLRSSQEAANRRDISIENSAVANIVVLHQGESLSSPRVRELAGPSVMSTVYRTYDLVTEGHMDPPEYIRPVWDKYVRLIRETPADHLHFRTHENHHTRIHPGEDDLITEELIRASCIAGTGPDLVAEFRALEKSGVHEVSWTVGGKHKWEMAREFAESVINPYRDLELECRNGS